MVEKWPIGYVSTYENNYDHIYDPLENIHLGLLVIFINFTQFWQCMSPFLTEHSFTDRSALYRIPLELVKNRKLHNEKLFF